MSNRIYKALMMGLSMILFFPFSVSAETHVYGKVLDVRVDGTGMGYVRFDVPRGNTPAACGDLHNYHLAFNANTGGGKGVLALALSAKVTGKTLVGIGTGECAGYNVVENWSWGYITN